MDVFGVGSAMLSAAAQQMLHARGTGRTAVLVDLLADNDMIVFSTAKDASEFAHAVGDRRPDMLGRWVSVVSPVPSGISGAAEAIRAREPMGRVLFDHSWLEQYYQSIIINGIKDVNKATAALSSRDRRGPRVAYNDGAVLEQREDRRPRGGTASSFKG